MNLEGSVLITGGSGSLGSAILDRAHREGWDAQFTVYSRDEVKQALLADRFPRVRFVLGDIRDPVSLTRAMREVDTVIHAAAYKRVPEAEREVASCIQSNVDGSLVVANTALASGVQRVVGISTDKAVSPMNVYGMTKALMERTFQAFSRLAGAPAFHLVRYGNVLASRGSVIPALQAQVEAGKPLTLTSPDMTRFWLTLDDAVSLVLRAFDMEPGEVFVPACWSASMGTLAEAVAPGWPIRVTGTRGGEKWHEALLSPEEAPWAREVDGGWAIRSMALAPGGELPEGFTYRSDTADHLTVADLQDILERMRTGQDTRTLV